MYHSERIKKLYVNLFYLSVFSQSQLFLFWYYFWTI